MIQRTLSLDRPAVRALLVILTVITVLLSVEFVIELLDHGVAKSGEALASTVSRAFNNLTAMVLTFIALAVPLTANMYTPKLVEIFLRDRVNIAVLLFYVGFAAHAIHAQATIAFRESAWQHVALVVSGVVGFTLLVPYYFYVLNFLNPATIIGRVRDGILRDLERAKKPSARIRTAQRRLHQEILNLGNVILRAIDRADRDVCLDGISALKTVLLRYDADFKSALPEAWFRPEPSLVARMPAEMWSHVVEHRTWVEHEGLHQFHLAFMSALARVPDSISAITRVCGSIGRAAHVAGDRRLTILCVRYFNTFLREALKRKDVHAAFDVLSQYTNLARIVAARAPDLTLRIARHVKYYAEFARWQQMPTVYELAAHDLSEVVEATHAERLPVAAELLEVFLSFEGERSATRLVKSQAMLAAALESTGYPGEAERLRAVVGRANPHALANAQRQILACDEPLFWEVADRQRNLDWIEADRRGRVVEILREAEKAQRAAEGAG